MDSLNNPPPKQSRELGKAVPAIIGWGIASLILSILVMSFNTSPLVLGAGFFSKSLGVILGAALGTIGALIGDALRRFAMPSFTFTSGGFLSLLFIRAFWLMGPQLIGLGLGAVIGCTLPLM